MQLPSYILKGLLRNPPVCSFFIPVSLFTFECQSASFSPRICLYLSKKTTFSFHCCIFLFVALSSTCPLQRRPPHFLTPLSSRVFLFNCLDFCFGDLKHLYASPKAPRALNCTTASFSPLETFGFSKHLFSDVLDSLSYSPSLNTLITHSAFHIPPFHQFLVFTLVLSHHASLTHILLSQLCFGLLCFI